MHSNPHPLAGQEVKLREKAIDPGQNMVVGGAVFIVEDYWDRVSGYGWSDAKALRNPACVQYAIRGSINRLPLDDEILYGKIDNIGHIIHVSEIEE